MPIMPSEPETLVVSMMRVVHLPRVPPAHVHRLPPMKGPAMSRLLSVALLLSLFAGVARAEIGCALPCTGEVPSDCCACKPRRKLGCGLLAHGCWLKRKSACHGGCDACETSGMGDCGSGECGRGCGHGKGCGLLAHRHCIDGLDHYFNCGCNGSYNYPVPPLYTYHWPGMYKAQRMTDYHSPWRFPPLRPYTEESLVPLIEEAPGPGTMTLAPIVHLRPLASGYPTEGPVKTAGEVESVSSRLERMGKR